MAHRSQATDRKAKVRSFTFLTDRMWRRSSSYYCPFHFVPCHSWTFLFFFGGGSNLTVSCGPVVLAEPSKDDPPRSVPLGVFDLDILPSFETDLCTCSLSFPARSAHTSPKTSEIWIPVTSQQSVCICNPPPSSPLLTIAENCRSVCLYLSFWLLIHHFF